MIANFFNKTNPINYIILLLLLLVLTFLYGFSHATLAWYQVLGQQLLVFILLSVCLILLEQLCQKKELTKNNSYAFLLAVLYILFIPGVFTNITLTASVFMVMLGIRRLMAIQGSKHMQTRLFDASILILTGALLEFWAIMFLVLVFYSILTSGDYNHRNWIIPIIAMLTVGVLYVSICEWTGMDWQAWITKQMEFSLHWNMQLQGNEALGFSVLMALLLLGTGYFLRTLPKKAINKKESYIKLSWAAVIGLVVFLISFQKTPEQLLWMVFPAAILSANYLEKIEDKRFQNFLLWVITLASFGLYYMQL
ncbi:MAG: DUF6427 family protein [Flavobacterium sp.]